MHKRYLFLSLVGIVSAGAVALIAACSHSSSSSSSSTSSYNYAGPGSNYTVSSAGGVYTFKKYANAGATSADFTVTATAVDLNGFKKFTVTGVTGSGGPSVGDTVYGFEVPGMALFVKPLDASNPDQVLVAVAAGTCPTTTFNANWIKVKIHSTEDLSQTSQDALGTFTYTAGSGTTGTASLPAKFSLAAPTTECSSGACSGTGFSSASCSNGIMRLSNGGDYITIYLTAIGAAIVNTSDTSSNADFIFGMPKPSSFTTTGFAGTYSGLYYMDSASSGSKLKPIKATLTTGSSTTISGSGSELSAVDTDTTTGGAASLSLTANGSYPGILTGTLTTSGTANIACVAVANANGSGKNVLDCAGIDPQSTGGLFNFLLVSR